MRSFLKTLFNLPTTIPFDPNEPLIELPVRLQHLDQELFTNFVLDTGATYTVIDSSLANYLKLIPLESKQVEINTASGVETAALAYLDSISIRDLVVEDTPVIITDLPESSGVAGLLGLSFIRQFKLTIERDRVRFKQRG